MSAFSGEQAQTRTAALTTWPRWRMEQILSAGVRSLYLPFVTVGKNWALVRSLVRR